VLEFWFAGSRVGCVLSASPALNGNSRRKALGAPENAAVPSAAAGRSGRAAPFAFGERPLRLRSTRFDPTGRSASLIPSGSSRFSASTSARLERFAPRAAVQREV